MYDACEEYFWRCEMEEDLLLAWQKPLNTVQESIGCLFQLRGQQPIIIHLI